MVSVDNFVSKLYSLILFENPKDEVRDWRILGQEHDGSLLFGWMQTSLSETKTKIGLYDYSQNKLEVLYSFDKPVSCIQASVDGNREYLLLVTKTPSEDSFVYKPFLCKLKTDKPLYDLQIERYKQVLVQFLYPKQSVLTENPKVKFLVLIHQESILQYIVKDDMFSEDSFQYESLVRMFTWAQWDCVNQTLYYIHYRKPSRGLVEGEETVAATDSKVTPTLSGLQFHDELPHESVLNIPLNLPNLISVSGSHRIYEDDTIPLRVHDCSLDLIVLTNPNGSVCICHHYLYQPIQPAVDFTDNDETPVHFAYSVTVLHQSCVMHCVIPEIPWNKAKAIRPLFKLTKDHLLVFVPDICTHLLDVGLMHEPCCHVTLKPIMNETDIHQLLLTPIDALGEKYAVNLSTLDLIDLTIQNEALNEMFKSDTLLENKLSILHYLILHIGDIDAASELVAWQALRPFTLEFPPILKEYLIATSFASVRRNIPSDANNLINLLPLTTQRLGHELEVNLNKNIITLSQDVLWNASMMLLSPQQRIIPYRSDIWVKLWEQLAVISKGKVRFKPSQVVEKLIISLVCYQPEVLSRSSTPMSPSGTLGASTALNDCLINQSSKRSQENALPFYEIESCTASKQEHIISVNLRELSMHILKQSSENKISRFQWQIQTPMHVHAIATRYITAQLEQSRNLCHILCKAATYEPKHELDKGFIYINQISEEKRYVLFTILERYYLSVESIAFPLPQGYSSFFTFLGYKTLKFDMFLQYVNRNVFELQVDVMKIILSDMDNSKTGVDQKLKLLSMLPRSRAKRLLNQWNHPISLMLRAREHSVNILSGVAGPIGKTHDIPKNSNKSFRGMSVPNNNYSPLDTFLDLLTAKASLTDLDFGLLIEATESSAEN